MRLDQKGTPINIAVVAPFFTQTEQDAIVTTVKTSKSHEHALSGHGWTLKKLRHWVGTQQGRTVSCNTLRTLLHAAGLSWKKCKKLLTKADRKQGEAFVDHFQGLYQQMCQEQVVLLYLDEVHVH